VGIVFFAAITAGVYSLPSSAPLWMAAALAVFPALLMTDAAMAVADRYGWLPEAAVTPANSAHDDIDGRTPRWALTVEGLVACGLLGWFGQSLYDDLRHAYPTTPGGLLCLTIIELWGFVLAAVKEVMAHGFKLLNHWRSDSRNNQHG
jgi:hypothetical protein